MSRSEIILELVSELLRERMTATGPATIREAYRLIARAAGAKIRAVPASERETYRQVRTVVNRFRCGANFVPLPVAPRSKRTNRPPADRRRLRVARRLLRAARQPRTRKTATQARRARNSGKSADPDPAAEALIAARLRYLHRSGMASAMPAPTWAHIIALAARLDFGPVHCAAIDQLMSGFERFGRLWLPGLELETGGLYCPTPFDFWRLTRIVADPAAWPTEGSA